MPQNDRENMNLVKGLAGTREVDWDEKVIPEVIGWGESEYIIQTKGETSSLRQENSQVRQLLYL